MPSGIFCTVRLDPFYQAFLRARFEQPPGEPFRFSKGHDLSLFFQAMLRPLPPDHPEPDHGENAFVIEIPWMEHKNPQTYRWISPERNVMFCGRVMRYWKLISHDIIAQARRLGMEKKEVIFFLLEELEIPLQYSDRVEREYSRYLQEERQRRFVSKNKMLKSVKKISDRRLKSL
jgi:hypothetical protein